MTSKSVPVILSVSVYHKIAKLLCLSEMPHMAVNVLNTHYRMAFLADKRLHLISKRPPYPSPARFCFPKKCGKRTAKPGFGLDPGCRNDLPEWRKQCTRRNGGFQPKVDFFKPTGMQILLSVRPAASRVRCITAAWVVLRNLSRSAQMSRAVLPLCTVSPRPIISATPRNLNWWAQARRPSATFPRPCESSEESPSSLFHWSSEWPLFAAVSLGNISLRLGTVN